jgi:putative spermidine/putrescine transport system substrate-binding protein
MDQISPVTKPASPAIIKTRRLRVLGTAVTLLDQVKEKAEADLGFGLDFEVLDFVSCQGKAALNPDAYDIYDQCFHNLDIVWFWGSLQPVDTLRISAWDKISDLTKRGGISRYAWRGHGDAPVKKLYVQQSDQLGSEQGRYISMLPTVYNLDSFGYDARVFGYTQRNAESWSWLLDRRAKGRIALVDEPAIGIFDAALAAEAAGEINFADIGNMSVAEVDQLMALLEDRRQKGFFHTMWRTAEDASQLVRDHKVAVQSMWSPAYGSLGGEAPHFLEAVPLEGYRAWHGGMSLRRGLNGAALDMAYEYMNWWLDGWAGAVMARQGYYFSVIDPVEASLTPDEWAYWYRGEEAQSDLPGAQGQTVVKLGARRSGGAHWDRANRIAVWNTVMDEHNYAARAWTRFVDRVRKGAP